MRLESLDFRQMGELTYRAIRDAIVTGEMEPGTKLSQEALAGQLGVSRAPVRDALNRLEAEGLVRTTPFKGAVVARMSTRELLDIFEARALVDSYTVRTACTRLSEQDLERLAAVIETTAELSVSGDLNAVVQAHADFHFIIYAACGNAELNRMARSLWDRSYLYRLTGLRDKAAALSSLEEHRTVLHALRDRDAQRAGELIASHNQETIKRLLGQVAESDGRETSDTSQSAASIMENVLSTTGFLKPKQ